MKKRIANDMESLLYHRKRNSLRIKLTWEKTQLEEGPPSTGRQFSECSFVHIPKCLCILQQAVYSAGFYIV